MSLATIFPEIESHELAAKLNIASDLKTFLRAATRQEPVRQLIRELDSAGAPEQLLRRVVQIAHRRIDPRYANPWDVPLAVYVWALDLKDSPFRFLVAGAAFEAFGTWWARKVAEEVFTEGVTRSDATSRVHEPAFEPVTASVSAEEYDSFIIADYSIPFIYRETEVQFAIPREDVKSAADDEIITSEDVRYIFMSTTSGTEAVQRLPV